MGQYWEDVQHLAGLAVDNAGLSRATVRKIAAAGLVGQDLRPMQVAVAQAELPDGSTLAIIEDATGAGKTEASVILAQRMIAAGKGQGIYFALPTMATADAMFGRMRLVLHRLFDGAPSLALLHGQRHLSEGFCAVRGNDGANINDAGCAAWIADDRRLSLLAEIGVGTIDQALMSVLPTRFNTLRMAALSQKILIIDEAHSYDPYMEAELCRLLRFHAGFGGSAILMTATLPKDMRQVFAKSWQEGLRRREIRGRGPDLTSDYPALSMIGANVNSMGVASVPANCRKLRVSHLNDATAAVQTIISAQSKGAACLWVRNAVDDAITAVSALRSAGIAADLLHARFAMSDRLAMEARLGSHFGRDGADRAGRVLVATQIVEMSLDFDFDVIVSDLAPIGSLIQRAGRLWRHMDKRPVKTRPVPTPILHVLSPDPDQVVDDRWLHQVLDKGAWVYPQDL